MTTNGDGNQHDSAAANGATHLLSFDVEEYFQVEAASHAVSAQQWESIPQRLGPCVDRILELLDRHGTTATFFVLGWVAACQKELVSRIARAGHEIASHGMTHSMIGRLDAKTFRQELLDSRSLLEDISGRAVVGFRAPTFSITRQTSWALDVLIEAGYSYDSSIFPVRHDRYGVSDAPPCAHIARGPGGQGILEIPPLTLRMFGANLPVGGGGYLRLLPARVVSAGLKRFARRGWPGMIYMHPWELDADQPVLPMRMTTRWRHRVGLRTAQSKLDRLLKGHSFSAVAPRLAQLKQQAHLEYKY